MPVPPPPRTYRCPACGWNKTVRPSSDALARGVDYFDRCPRCSTQPLKSSTANKIEVFQSYLEDFFRS